MPRPLRFDGETENQFKERAEKRLRCANFLIDACLQNECVQTYIADPDLPLWTEHDMRQSPIIRVEYEQGIAYGSIGECLAATKSKYWGLGPQILPLKPDDWLYPTRITYEYRESSLYNRRYLQRMRMKELLGKRFRKLVGEAKYHTKTVFLEHLTVREARAIRNRLGCEPGEMWRAAQGKFFLTLPEPPKQLEFDFDN